MIEMEKSISLERMFSLQQNTKKKAKKKITLVQKPFLRGCAWSGYAVKAGFRLLMYEILFIFLNLLIGSTLSFETSTFLRIATNLVLVAAYGGLVYMNGARAGDSDVAFAEIAYGRKESGKNVAKSDLNRCYHPAKGFVSVLTGTGILLLVALVYALCATKQTYSLQTLPSWVSSYSSSQQEIGLALSYYSIQRAVQLEDILRPFIRICIWPFVNIAGARNYDALLLVDRLSPLIILLPYLFYAFGYLQGPRSRAMLHGSIATDKKRRIRKEKKERKQRQQKTNQLI